MNTPLALAFSPVSWTALDWANHLWQSSVVALVLLLLLAGGRKLRARTRLAIGWMALIKFILPISLLVAGAKQVGEVPARWLTSETFAVPVNLPAAPAAVSFTPTPAPVAAPAAAFSGIAMPLWLTGVLACGVGWTLLAWRARRRLLTHATPISETVEAHVTAVATLAGLKTRPRCVAVAPGHGPALVGLWRPVVILPRGLEEALMSAEYRAVLLHEFVHLRRRDNLQAAIRAGFGALLWFNPLVWLVNRRLRLEMEKACDERVLELTGDARAYASGIVKTVRQSLGLERPGFASVTTPPIVARIEDILAHDNRRSGKRRNALALAAGVGVVGLSGHAGLIGAVRAAEQPAANSVTVDSGQHEAAIGFLSEQASHAQLELKAAAAKYAETQRRLQEIRGVQSDSGVSPEIKLPHMGEVKLVREQNAPLVPPYVLRPGDLIRVQVFQREDLNRFGTLRLSADSTAILPLLGQVDLKNKTVPQTQELLRALYARAGVDAPVAVAVFEYAPRDSQSNPAPTTAAAPAPAKEATLSVDFPDEDIRRVLRNVGDLFELKLVLPDTLRGNTTVKLNDVTWRQIFRAVLEPVGHTFVESDGFIKVVPKDNARSVIFPAGLGPSVVSAGTLTFTPAAPPVAAVEPVSTAETLPPRPPVPTVTVTQKAAPNVVPVAAATAAGAAAPPRAGDAKASDILVYELRNLDRIPIVTSQVKPVFPPAMQAQRIPGEAVVDFIVDPQGNVINVSVARSSQREFEQPAVDAVSKWKFRPGTKAGKPVHAHMQMPIVFTFE